MYAIKAWNKLDHEIGNTETNASLQKMFLTFIVLFDKRKCWGWCYYTCVCKKAAQVV